ncbi:DUF6378 domain-containing protein [Pararhodobacter sp.]|uniref:DUF6378 domain-containing protein n=1 Tax=Pararhodobacter sp. TaxID=2127056 RepID=UPI002FDCA3EC
MKRSEVLNAARQAVTIDRAATHGKPEDSFGQIARVWSARLGVTVTPAQVCILLADLKGARAWSNPAHADNWVDLAGYAACGGELAGGTVADLRGCGWDGCAVEGGGPLHVVEGRETAEAMREQSPDALVVFFGIDRGSPEGDRTVIEEAEPEDCPPGNGQVAPVDDDAEGGSAGPSGAVKADALTAAPDQGQRPQTAGKQGGALPTSDDPAPDPVAAVTHQSGELNRGAWSEREDAIAVRMRLEGANPPEIAKVLHRPVPATEYRVYKTLRDRINAARENREGSARPNATASPEAPGAGAAAAPVPAPLPADAAAGNAAEAAPGAGDLPLPTLQEHLDALPADGWNQQDDLELMNVTVLQYGIPALEELFGVKVAVLRKRKLQLTDNDRFTADQVQAELQARADARG